MQDYIAELYSKYSMYLLYIIKNGLYDGCPKDAAYDILDEVFEAALEKTDKDSLMDNPKAWLTATAKCKIDNYNRTACGHGHKLIYDSSLRYMPYREDLAKDAECLNLPQQNFYSFFQKKLSKNEKYLYDLKDQEHSNIIQAREDAPIAPDTSRAGLNWLRAKIRKFLQKNIN